MKQVQPILPLLVYALMSLAAGASANQPKEEYLVEAAKTMTGHVVCGYQGWYRTPTDGSKLGFEHYETDDAIYPSEMFSPGYCAVEYWPDMSEAGEDEKYPTAFDHKNGKTAYVFSSQNQNTVNRHFKWMKDYGIDGVFLQRFAHDVLPGGHHQWELLQPSNNTMVGVVQQGARAHDRSFAIMYDLSSIRHGEVPLLKEDWRGLNRKFNLLQDPNYQHHLGKPVVTIWGVGFNDGRKYTLDEVGEFIDFLQNDSEFGGCTVAIGIPAFWRTFERDAVRDSALHDIIKKADMMLPWSVGRFGGHQAATRHGENVFNPDVKWCEQNGIEYLPLAFPGFSWANRKGPETHQFNKIPREGGRFLWAQAVAAKRAGAKMIYIAMFDEMDEGTQIFKVTSDPPNGASQFLSYAPLEPDFYLRLTGEIGKMLRGEIPTTDALPTLPASK